MALDRYAARYEGYQGQSPWWFDEMEARITRATDDGKPRTRPMAQFGTRTVPNSATGLRLVWLKYRGAGEVSFAQPQFSA